MKLICFLLLSFTVFSQEKYRISGSVKDAKTGVGIPGASIYLEGTTLGTQADSAGNYHVNRIATGRYRLVASFVGYKPRIQFIEVRTESKVLNLTLEEDNQTLDEVRVSSTRDKTWEKQIRIFEKAFLEKLGRSKYADFDAKPIEEQQQIKAAILKDLLHRDQTELETMQNNSDNFRVETPDFEMMMKKKLSNLKRKIDVKNYVLKQLSPRT